MNFASFAGGQPAGAALAVLVRGYQLLIRPVLPPACRFEPSCSAYAIEALRTHGAVRGLLLAAWRILRCNPWGGCGHDPVPRCFHLRTLAPAGPHPTRVPASAKPTPVPVRAHSTPVPVRAHSTPAPVRAYLPLVPVQAHLTPVLVRAHLPPVPVRAPLPQDAKAS